MLLCIIPMSGVDLVKRVGTWVLSLTVIMRGNVSDSGDARILGLGLTLSIDRVFKVRVVLTAVVTMCLETKKRRFSDPLV